ncbi:MAG TPA: hypothetical protein VD738_02450 [Nitrospira sp.]|nr:hypothetical protein [Nitrospira sp.]
MSDRMIDIFAGTLIVLAVVKLLALAVNAPAWLSAMKMLYARPALTAAISYLLAGLVLAALLASGVTIVQVLAVCLFVVLLLVPTFAPYMGLVLRGLEGKSLGQMLREQWLYTVVWMILLGWGFYALLNR